MSINARKVTYYIRHDSDFRYEKEVSLCHSLAHLTARTCARQTRVSAELEVSVTPAVLVPQVDCFGNPAIFFAIQEPHRTLKVGMINVVEVHPQPTPKPADTAPWDDIRDGLKSDRSVSAIDAYQFTFDSPYVKADDALRAYALPSFPRGRPILDAMLDLTARIYRDFTFDSTATTTTTPIAEVLEHRRGVCQDFAHLEIGCLRSLGLAARYVSGYLQTNPPPGRRRLIGADASHAWLSVYCHDHGWIDLDPTNNQIPLEKHIVLSWGRDYDDVSPIKGVILGGGRHSLAVAVDVLTMDEFDGHKPASPT